MTLSAGDFVVEVLFCVCFTIHDISQSLFSLALGLTQSPTWWVGEALANRG
jgi:hypothetical protein